MGEDSREQERLEQIVKLLQKGKEEWCRQPVNFNHQRLEYPPDGDRSLLYTRVVDISPDYGNIFFRDIVIADGKRAWLMQFGAHIVTPPKNTASFEQLIEDIAYTLIEAQQKAPPEAPYLFGPRLPITLKNNNKFRSTAFGDLRYCAGEGSIKYAAKPQTMRLRPSSMLQRNAPAPEQTLLTFAYTGGLV